MSTVNKVTFANVSISPKIEQLTPTKNIYSITNSKAAIITVEELRIIPTRVPKACMQIKAKHSNRVLDNLEEDEIL